VFDKNYGVNKTDFLMCYLVHHLSADVWTFAFWDGDLATPDHVRHAYKRMKETFYLGDKVKFRPDSSYQERVAKQLGSDVPVILNDQIYQAADYVAFNQGVAIGMLGWSPGIPTPSSRSIRTRSSFSTRRSPISRRSRDHLEQF
jgi:hypothetical protein